MSTDLRKFGLYIHIPYCLQICSYCDFAKYEVGKIPDQDHYTQLLLTEIRQKQHLVPKITLTSIYFGGGTPSLLSSGNFDKILKEIKKYFEFHPDIEITIEINPGNLSEKKLVELLELGINRFSVGSQTFEDDLLKKIGRKHSSEETKKTLNLLNKYQVNFSMDLLFALPHQTISSLKHDMEEALQFSPFHVSTYYLNVPDKHMLSKGRPSDNTQVEMFHLIEDTLKAHSLWRYEISNYAKKGYESTHNLIYWTDQSYWGVGLSSHSFFHPSLGEEFNTWGIRFWNPRSYEGYERYINSLENIEKLFDKLDTSNLEILEKHQSMTEYCYTSLRKMTGLNIDDFEKKFSHLPRQLSQELSTLISRGLISKNSNVYTLTQEGKILSNLVFERLTFLKEDLY